MTQASEQKILQKTQKEIEISHQVEDKMKEAIKLINNQGRYQVLAVTLLSICSIFAMYQLCVPSFFFMNPNFQCAGEPVSEEEACLRIHECVVTNDYTITAENHLYCDRKDTRSLIQAMFGVGAMLGVLFINFVSDYQGRKFSMVVGLFAQIVSIALTLIGSHYDIVPLFMVSLTLAGFGTNSFIAVAYVYLTKILSKIWGDRSVLIFNGVGNFAELTVIFFINYSSWKMCAFYAMLIPTIVILLMIIFLMVEDPIILYSRDKIEQSKASVSFIAKFNGTEAQLPEALKIIDDLKQQGFQITQKDTTLSERMQYLKLLLRRTIIVSIFCIGIHQFGANLIYFSLLFSISQIGYSYGVSLFIFGVVEFVGIFPLMACPHRVPRKSALIFMVLLIIGICMSFLLDLSDIMETVLLSAIKFILSSQYVVYIYLSVETFPQHIQSTAYGIIEFLGQTCKLVAPLEVDVSKQLGIDPIVALGVLAVILMLVPLFFVKETLKPEKDSKQQQDTEASLLSQ